MKIQTLIARLTAIAVYRPDAVVYVEDGMLPSDICPITSIEPNVFCHTGNVNSTTPNLALAAGMRQPEALLAAVRIYLALALSGLAQTLDGQL